MRQFARPGSRFVRSSRSIARAACIAAVAGCVALACAQEPRSAAPVEREDERLSRLETRLIQQQERLMHLEGRLAGQASRELDDARVDVMRRQIRAVLADDEFRSELAASTLQAGYDDGFFLASGDEQFSLKANGFVQMRWTHYGTRSVNRDALPGVARSDRDGFDLQRARIILSGNAHSPDLTYYLHFRADSDDNYDAWLYWGYVNYRFAEEFQVTAGLMPLPSTRAYFLDERGYQFVDLTMVDTVFGLGDGVGVTLWGKLLDKKLDYYLALTNEMDGPAGGVITSDSQRVLDNNPAVTFRTVWHVLGEDSTEQLYEGDLENLAHPVLDLGFHYGFNQDDGDVNTVFVPYPRRGWFRSGGFGEAAADGLQINQFGVDSHFKWRGFSLTGAYALRLLDVTRGGRGPLAPLFVATGDGSTTAQHGAYVQVGQFLPIPDFENKIELVARVGGISTLSGRQEGMWEYAGGVNYYFKGHNAKLQMDVTKISEAPVADSSTSLANINDDALIWRLQLQVAF